MLQPVKVFGIFTSGKVYQEYEEILISRLYDTSTLALFKISISRNKRYSFLQIHKTLICLCAYLQQSINIPNISKVFDLKLFLGMEIFFKSFVLWGVFCGFVLFCFCFFFLFMVFDSYEVQILKCRFAVSVIVPCLITCYQCDSDLLPGRRSTWSCETCLAVVIFLYCLRHVYCIYKRKAGFSL